MAMVRRRRKTALTLAEVGTNLGEANDTAESLAACRRSAPEAENKKAIRGFTLKEITLTPVR